MPISFYTRHLWAIPRRGVVKDANTGETILGATVLVQGTATGTITNLMGKYTITVSDDTDVLVFSFIGY